MLGWSLLISHITYAQIINNLYFNSTTNILRLNFSASSPTASYTGIGSGASIGEGIAHAEDKEGNLLFWVNASGVYDKNGTQMGGSGGILAHPSSTEIVICPFPAHPTKFYIFYNNQLCSELYYAVVDMELRGGLGDVSSKNTVLDGGSSYGEGLEIVKIPCSADYWLLAYQCYKGFTRFRISASGISLPTLLASYSTDTHNGRGELDYHLGRLGYAATYRNQAFLAQFNPATGELSEAQTLRVNATNGLYGLEFSPDASKVYFTDWHNRNFLGSIVSPNLFCYNFASRATSSWTVAYNTTNCQNTTVEGLGQIELGKDGKLYIPHVNGCQITVVETPNEAVPTLSLIDVNTILSTGVSDHIQSEVYMPLQISPDQTICQGESIRLGVSGGSKYEWQPAAGLQEVTSANPLVSPIVTTTYRVYAQNSYGCRDSAQVTVSVRSLPAVTLSTPSGTLICGSGDATLLAPDGYASYVWYKEEERVIGEDKHTLTVREGGVYFVEVSSKEGCSARSQKVTFTHSPIATPSIELRGSTKICRG